MIIYLKQMLDKLLIKLFTIKDDMIMCNEDIKSLCRYCIVEKDMIALKRFLQRCVPRIATNMLEEVISKCDSFDKLTIEHEDYILYYLNEIADYLSNPYNHNVYVRCIEYSCKVNSERIFEFICNQKNCRSVLRIITESILKVDHLPFFKKICGYNILGEFYDIYYYAVIHRAHKCFEWLLDGLCLDTMTEEYIILNKNCNSKFNLIYISDRCLRLNILEIFKIILNKLRLLFISDDVSINNVILDYVKILLYHYKFEESKDSLDELSLIIKKFPEGLIKWCFKSENPDYTNYLDYFINQKGCEYKKEHFDMCFLRNANLEWIQFSMNYLNITKLEISNMSSLLKFNRFDLYKLFFDQDLVNNVYQDGMFKYLYHKKSKQQCFLKEFNEHHKWWTNFYLWSPKHLRPSNLSLDHVYIKDVKDQIKSVLNQVDTLNEKQLISIVQNYVSDY